MYVSLILNDLWMIRHYHGNRTPAARLRRKQAIAKLGLDLREALNICEDHTAILRAMYEGIYPKDEAPF